MTAGRVWTTQDLTLATLCEEIQLTTWLSKMRGEGPSGHHLERSEHPPVR